MNARSVRHVLPTLLIAGLSWSVSAGQWRFPVGLSYSQGIWDASDKIFDLYEDAGWHVDDRTIVPVGLTFSPYYEWDCGFGAGLSLGPAAFIFVDEQNDYYYYHHDHDDYEVSAIVPIGADVRYTFFRDRVVSPYLRVGIRYPIVGGHNVDGSEPGPFGAVGLTWWRDKAIAMGVEFGYDASEVTVKGPDGTKKEVTFGGFMAGVFFEF